MDTVTGKPPHKELPSKRKRAKRLDPALRQELILDSATRLVQTRDTANFTLDEVAIEAGVSRPLIHRYFPCRDSLLLALLERDEGNFEESLAQLKQLLADTQRPNGRYTEGERGNRRIFMTNVALLQTRLET